VETREQWQALTAEFRAAFVELTKTEANTSQQPLSPHDEALLTAREKMRVARKKMDDFRSQHPHLVD